MCAKICVMPLCSVVDYTVGSCTLCRLEDVAEDRTPPGPGVVSDHVGRVGNKWSIVCDELACLVKQTSPLPAWTHESRVC